VCRGKAPRGGGGWRLPHRLVTAADPMAGGEQRLGRGCSASAARWLGRAREGCGENATGTDACSPGTFLEVACENFVVAAFLISCKRPIQGQIQEIAIER